MLAAPALPAPMPLMSLKRNLSCYSDSVHQPSSKRRRLTTKDDQQTENDDLLVPYDRQGAKIKVLPHVTPQLSAMGRTAFMKEVQLSFVVTDQSFNMLQPLSSKLSKTNGMGINGKARKPITMEVLHHPVRSCHIVDNDKGSDEMQTTKDTVHVAKCTDGSTSSCFTSCESDPDSATDSSESGLASMPKSELKQPAIVLMKMRQPPKKRQLLATSCPGSLSKDSGVLVGGYVHRMANLNARACVAAFLQPERNGTSRRHRRNEKSAKSKARKSGGTTKRNTLTQCVSKVDFSPTKAAVLNVNGSIPITVNVDGKGMEIPRHAMIVQDVVGQDAQGTQYNKTGLLYNGDTVHPSARVFLSRSAKNELEMPKRIYPTLIPSRSSTVQKVIKNAISNRTVSYTKKGSKKNNGWNPLGKPIKVVKSPEGLVKKYYAGIKRRKEEIYVRDCVIINAGTVKVESPYVAKIGSIWQEPDGLLMMTTFWYYRSEDVEVQQAGIQCAPKELLASQHHDNNSVECIEDKCYVIGLSQYSRYLASDIKHATTSNKLCGISPRDLVPPTMNKATTSHSPEQTLSDNDNSNLVELDPEKRSLVELGPSLSDLRSVDPSLVFLCYRGFNHISGKLQTGRAVLMKV